MSTARSARQIKKEGNDELAAYQSTLEAYVADRGVEPTTDPHQISVHADEVDTVQRLTAIAAERIETEARLLESTNLASRYRRDPQVAELLETVDEYDSSNDQIIRVFGNMCAADDNLALRLHDLVQERGSSVILARQRLLEEVKEKVRHIEEIQGSNMVEQERALTECQTHRSLLENVASVQDDQIKILRDRNTELSNRNTELSNRNAELADKAAKADSWKEVALGSSASMAKQHEGLKRLTFFLGFGVDAELDVEDLLKRSESYQPIALDRFKQHCQQWRQEIPIQAERMTGIEVLMVSISKVEDISMQSIEGFVRSRPAPVQLVFIEEALKNVAGQLIVTFEQAMFLLRGLQFLWQSIPWAVREGNSEEKKDIAKGVLRSMDGKLPESPLVQAYHAWLLDVMDYDVSTPVDRYVLQHAPTPSLALGQGALVFMDHNFLIVAHNGTPLIGDRILLHHDLNVTATYWDIWVEGFPTIETPLTLRLQTIEENLTLLEDLFEPEST